MKNFTHTLVCISITCALSAIGSCKMDAPILPDNLVPRGSEIPSTGKEKLLVSTFATGIPGPTRICYDKAGNLFVSSVTTNKVFKIDISGDISVVLEGRKEPCGLKTDGKGNLIVALTGEDKLVKITPVGKVSDVKLNLELKKPKDIAIADDGTLFIADTYNNRIVKVNEDGQASVFAGKAGVFGIKDGKGDQAHFSYPTALRLSSDGVLWVLDGDGVSKVLQGQTVRQINANGSVSTIYRQNNKAASINDFAIAKRNKDMDDVVAVNMFLVKSDNGIYHLAPGGTETLLNTTTPGSTDGDISKSKFSSPVGICVRGNEIFVADNANNSVRKIATR